MDLSSSSFCIPCSGNDALQFIFCHHSMDTQETKYMCVCIYIVWSKTVNEHVSLVRQKVYETDHGGSRDRS